MIQWLNGLSRKVLRCNWYQNNFAQVLRNGQEYSKIYGTPNYVMPWQVILSTKFYFGSIAPHFRASRCFNILNNILYREFYIRVTKYTTSALNMESKITKFSICSLPFQISCYVRLYLGLQMPPLHFWQFQLDSFLMIQKEASSVEQYSKDSNSIAKCLQMFHRCLQLLSDGKCMKAQVICTTGTDIFPMKQKWNLAMPNLNNSRNCFHQSRRI